MIIPSAYSDTSMIKKANRSSAQDYDASQSGSGITGNDLFRVRKDDKALA